VCAEAVLDTSICDGGNGVFQYKETDDGECQCYTSSCDTPYKDHTQYDLYKTESNYTLFYLKIFLFIFPEYLFSQKEHQFTAGCFEKKYL
jgi:hypothetical protein